jgi:hypothetical protein
MTVPINKTTEEDVLIIINLQNYKEFKRGIFKLSIPRIEALALPISENRQRRAHVDMKITHKETHITHCDCTQLGATHAYKGLHGIDIITPGTSTVGHIQDRDCEFARFDTSQTQRRVNAINMYVRPRATL